MRKKRSPAPLLLPIVIACFASTAASGQQPAVRHFGADPASGMSAATLVTGDAALAHTAQIFPVDQSGSLVGRGEVGAQVDRVLANLRGVLNGVGAELDHLVKLNVYTANAETADAVRVRLARVLSAHALPAVTYASGVPALEGALLSVDAVALAPHNPGALTVQHVSGAYGPADRGHVAVVPKDALVYVSGQVANEEDLVASMRETLEASHARIGYLGLSNYDVAQVKVFLTDIGRAEEIAEEIAAYYRRKPAPPMIFLEWQNGGANIEIELIAARREPDSGGSGAVAYTTPPGLQAIPTYSRIAEINRGDLVYLSGLYGDPAKDVEGQMRDIFARMGAILAQTGSDFDHLLKATYYVTDRSAFRPLHTVRGEYFKPDRPPTSSLIIVRDPGKRDHLLTIEMIGVVPR